MEYLFIVVVALGAIAAIGAYTKKKRRERLLVKYGDTSVVDKIMRRIIWQGMSEERLVDSWGRPVEKAQHVYKTKTAETFKYNQTGKNRFGSRVRVENGIVVGWEKK